MGSDGPPPLPREEFPDVPKVPAFNDPKVEQARRRQLIIAKGLGRPSTILARGQTGPVGPRAGSASATAFRQLIEFSPTIRNATILGGGSADK